MGYQVLARKWRPKTFEELAGQEHVLKALVNALENQRLHHAYLFTGTRGVGKTTIARILARSLNCETGVTSTPCGSCSACQEINDGRFVDLIEVDAASRTKVEDTRDLLENIQYLPTRGRYKIYLIDEVHMLSTHSFNALLKTLEEPPDHVKFLLATTDPQKLPVTVLSRCLQFNLKNLTSARIQEHLQFVLGEEKVPSEVEALWHLARAARGSMRDALSLTDQAISHGGGKLSEADVVTMLGTVDRKRIYELMDALAVGNAEKALQISDSLAEISPDYYALVEDMLLLMHGVAVFQSVPNAQKKEGFEDQKLAEYAQLFSPEEIQLIYQMLLMGQKDFAVTPDLHMGFEMLLLRLIAFQPAKSGEILSEARTQSSTADPRQEPAAKKPEAAQPPESGDRVPVSTLLKESVQSSAQEILPEQTQQQIQPHSDNKTPALTAIETRESVVVNTDVAELAKPEITQPVPTALAGASQQQAPQRQEPKQQEGKQQEPRAENDQAQTELSAEQPVGEQGAAIISVSQDAVEAPRLLSELNRDNWIALFNALSLRGMVKSLCSHLVFNEFSSSGLSFDLAEPGQKVFEQSHQDKLTQALSEYFSEPIGIQVTAAAVDRETPAEWAQRRHQEQLAEAERSILQSPVVLKLVEEFQAELVPGSVYLNPSVSE